MTLKDWEIAIHTDLLDMGSAEDGSPYYAEGYFVTVTHKRGRRFAHNHLFTGCKIITTDDGLPYFEDTRKEAKRNAEVLVNRMKSKGNVDLDFWTELEPSFGSPYYCEVKGI